MPSNIPVRRRRSGSDSEGVPARQRRSWRASWRHSWASGPSQRRVNFAQWRSRLFDKIPDQNFQIVVMQIFSFLLLMLIVVSRILRFVAVLCLYLWIKLMKLGEFIVYIFRRVFSAEPDKINQNADYTHIEGKSVLLFNIHISMQDHFSLKYQYLLHYRWSHKLFKMQVVSLIW